jgi:hypothetical protein
MEFFRTHIARTVNVCLLLVGMALYFMKPVSEQADHDAFTSWLQSNLKTGNNASVTDQIKDLQNKTDGLESIIRQASVLVKAHSDDFELPVDAQSKDENEVFQVLLTEWNAYQTSSGMGRAVIVKPAKPHSVLPIDGLAFAAQDVRNLKTLHTLSISGSAETPASEAENFNISPLSGGTAIGAP